MESIIWSFRSFFSNTVSNISHSYLGALLLFCVLSVILFFMGIHSPLYLLFGPLLYSYLVAKDFKNFLMHCFPFIFYQVINVGHENSIAAFDVSIEYLFVIGASLGIYAILSLMVINRSRYDFDSYKLGSQLSMLFLFSSIFIVVQVLEQMTNIPLGFDPEYLILGIFLFSCLIICQHFHSAKFSGVKETAPDSLKKGKPVSDLEISMEYLEKLKGSPLKEEIFLNSNLTLEKLSKELDIPKHHLSKCLKSHRNTNFYEFIAEFRIKYAIEQIESRNLMTLESLAYECGFNSKNSFNKYFRKYVGILPSEYRKRFGGSLKK